MTSYHKFFVYPSKLEDLYENGAVVVPDANFLLAAYQSRDITTEAIKKVLLSLSKENKLVLLEQVIHEFSIRRQDIISAQLNAIDDETKKYNAPNKAIQQFLPMLEGTDKEEKFNQLKNSLSQGITNYNNHLKSVRSLIKKLLEKDDHFDFIKSLCDNSYYQLNEDKENLIKEGLDRISKGIKPGTQEHKANPTGDYLIWVGMMNLDKDVIFLSNDQKRDWLFKDNKNNALSIDQSLLSEFHDKTNGKKFLHVTPKTFIKYINPKIDEKVEQDLDLSPITSIFNHLPKRYANLIFAGEESLGHRFEIIFRNLDSSYELENIIVDIKDIFIEQQLDNVTTIKSFTDVDDYILIIDMRNYDTLNAAERANITWKIHEQYKDLEILSQIRYWKDNITYIECYDYQTITLKR
ncbi:PIN-like domain-containing protein [Terribacillus saccharophilus]|uniref:PIN-like domain-containing protein n=1 Tax=Terribacillus saccharophilus TaxID=361277 RepID=UPI000C9D19F1|nr:PIN-like domain-containing protein [Terribacillus goriensis]